jgi:ribonuclease HI
MIEHVRIYTDGGARGNPGPAGSGAVIKFLHEDGAEGEVLAALHAYIGETTNNQAEYQAIILGLQKAQELGAQRVDLFMDSELAVKQLNGEYKVKNPGIAKKFLEVYRLLQGFQHVSIRHVPREQNREADALVNAAIDEYLKNRSRES